MNFRPTEFHWMHRYMLKNGTVCVQYTYRALCMYTFCICAFFWNISKTEQKSTTNNRCCLQHMQHMQIPDQKQVH